MPDLHASPRGACRMLFPPFLDQLLNPLPCPDNHHTSLNYDFMCLQCTQIFVRLVACAPLPPATQFSSHDFSPSQSSFQTSPSLFCLTEVFLAPSYGNPCKDCDFLLPLFSCPLTPAPCEQKVQVPRVLSLSVKRISYI